MSMFTNLVMNSRGRSFRRARDENRIPQAGALVYGGVTIGIVRRFGHAGYR